MLSEIATLAQRFRGRRLLVTGGAGCIGANLIRILLDANCAVHATIRQHSTAWRLEDLTGDLKLHVADVGNPSELDRVFESARPDTVFHLATPRGADKLARDEMLRVNVIGAAALIQCSRRHQISRLIVAGSSLEYAPSSTALGELARIAPKSWHGVTKAAAALLYQQAAQEDGFPVALLRLFHVYGPWESSHRLIPTAIRAGQSGAVLSMTARDFRRDCVYVEDVCEALMLAALKAEPGEVFNIGSGKETSNLELVAEIERVTGHRIAKNTQAFPPRITDCEHRFADPSKAMTDLEWQPRHDLRRGLQKTVDWLHAHPHAWSHPSDILPSTV